MGKYDFNEEAAVVDSTGGAMAPGVYEATVITCSETTASTGTEGFDWNLEIGGKTVIIYGMWCWRPDGSTIFNAETVNKLQGIVGAKKLTTFIKEIETKSGKKKVSAIKEFDGIKVQVALGRVYDVYNDEENSKNEIKEFFNKDGKTFGEAKGNKPAKQKAYHAKAKDKYTEKWKKWNAEADDAPEVEAEEEQSEGGLL